jgi:small GTP-binding protein
MVTLSKKVCLVGDFAVGKTSLVRRFVHDLFDDRYLSTIGVKVSRKTVSLANGPEVVELTMMLWDLAGSEEFTRMRASYLRGTSGVLMVGDLTRPETFTSLINYKQDVDAISPGAPCLLAANKADLLADNGAGRTMAASVQTLADDLGALLYLTSALTGDQVEEAFRHMARLMTTGNR